MQYAFFAPYTLERHSDLVAELQMDERVRVESLGAHTVCLSPQVFASTCSWRITGTLPLAPGSNCVARPVMHYACHSSHWLLPDVQ